MLLRHRRIFALLAFCLLAAPLVVGLIAPDSPASVFREGRSLAPAPHLPTTGASWLALPAAVDAYLKDHFGLRQKLITAHRELTKPMLGFGNDSVLVGPNGRMFFLGEGAVRQSAGRLVRDQRVAEATDMLLRMNDELQARGIRFLVAVPPNSATIYQEDLPLWAQNSGKPTEYDILLTNLAAKGVTTVDLRPAIKNARTQGPVFYMHDTHWTFRGAIAAYDAIVEADARADWRIEPASALGPVTMRKGGDLARMLGVGDTVSEYAEPLTLPYAKELPQSFDPVGAFTETSYKTGPTILILGDSSAGIFFPPMVLQHAGRVIWMSYLVCGFDWNEVEKYGPDEVWWMPTERNLVCLPGVKPKGLPESKADSAHGNVPAGIAAQMGGVRSRDGARE
jgi:alginate O-acetyltransferase complex protein AlgJ